MKISVIGTGYVGLVTGICFSDLGNFVTCIDKDPEKIKNLNKGISPIFEQGLEPLLKKNIKAKRLCFTTNLEETILKSDVHFIAVGTPPNPDGSADLSQVKNVCREISLILKSNPKKRNSLNSIVVKSTVPVGTCRTVAKVFEEEGLTHKEIGIVSNPEFLRQGQAVNDFFRPDRVIVGGHNQESVELVSNLYDPLYRIDTPIIQTSWETAELTKYASNVFLATKISFINEIANICEAYNADVHEIAKAMGLDGRIGKYFLHPGPGYGGSCFPKDTKALIHIAKEKGYEFKIGKAVNIVNDYQKLRVVDKISTYFNNQLKGKTIAILGLAFKSNTDDMRDAPAIVIINSLLKKDINIQVFDPNAMKNSHQIFGDSITYKNNSYEAVTGADAMVILTEWHDFRLLDMPRIKKLLKTPVIFDTRNIYNPYSLIEMGFDYFGTGR